MSHQERLEDEGASDSPDPPVEAPAGGTPSTVAADFTSDVLGRLADRKEGHARYRRQEEISHGGQGVILRVWDEDLERHLAMKAMLGRAVRGGSSSPADRHALARFLEEARVTSQLDHPGIVPVHELGLDDQGRAYFTMKLVKGEDLRAVFEKVQAGREGWTEARALGVLSKVCEAMAYAHAKGVIHRDLKPGNVMVGRYGEVHVMDWGLARVIGREDRRDVRISRELHPTAVFTDRRKQPDEASDSPLMTMDGHVVGTPCYMPPEQALGKLDEIGQHSDVYALGAMLYHLLAGHAPYVKPGMKLSNYAVWYRAQEGSPDALHERAPRAPAELLAIVEKAMARDWRERYPDMGALGDDLRAYLEHRVVKAYRVGAWIELEKWVERNRRLAVSIGAGILAILLGLVSSLVLRAKATHNEVLARENERLAIERADEVLRLSALQRLDDLVNEADRLWPITPDLVERYRAWLSAAEELVSELPSYELTRSQLRSRGKEGTVEGRASWTFAATEDRWWHDQLTKLIEGLRVFSNREHGLCSAGISPEHGWSIERRLDFARTVEERSITGAEARARWDEALASIRDLGECPWYARLALSPQVGLLPIGRDPTSGLWEFAHLQTGEPAVRGADGELLVQEGMGLVFVLLPGGTFRMGAQRADPAQPNYDPLAMLDEQPVHGVELSPFFLSKYEMTQEQWERITGANPSYWGSAPLLPIEQVNWFQCNETCRQLGLALASEAQWEYGTRAGSDTPWWSGTDPALLSEVANLADESYRIRANAVDKLTEDWDDGAFEPARVGQFAPNPFGLHDVHGNVWEWCRDAFGPYEEGRAGVDPAHLDGGSPNHACRGGSFDNGAVSARSAVRLDLASAFVGYYLGLRPIRRIGP